MRFALALALAVVAEIATDTPPSFQSGNLPVLPIMSAEVGGGEVLLEVRIDPAGAVAAIKPLRETATFTERMAESVKTWHFAPASRSIADALRKPGGPTSQPIESRVLVAGIFRPPALIGPTLGEPVHNVATASSDLPFPTSIVTPPFPPMVLNPGVVLVEVSVDENGGVADAKVRVSAPGFDSAALDAARQWTFRAARLGGSSTASVMYIVFGFRLPASPINHDRTIVH